MLTRFARADNLYPRGTVMPRLETVVDMLLEIQHVWQDESPDFRPEHELTVRRHIGDYTLFMTGLFPEYLRRLKAAGPIYHKDFLVDYVKTGKRSYAIVAEHTGCESDGKTGPLFQKLSENFELCVTGLGFVRTELERLRDSSFQRTKHLLSN
jgi:hypothetical protein